MTPTDKHKILGTSMQPTEHQSNMTPSPEDSTVSYLTEEDGSVLMLRFLAVFSTNFRRNHHVLIVSTFYPLTDTNF